MESKSDMLNKMDNCSQCTGLYLMKSSMLNKKRFYEFFRHGNQVCQSNKYTMVNKKHCDEEY